jgi:ubiquinone/menaquinone biosynthesis C-methylase UbiE
MQEWNKKRKTMRHYDRQAKIYDAQYLEEQNAKIEDALNGMELGSNDLILDLGCGTGFLFPHVDKTSLLVGIDASSKALQVAKNRTKKLSNTVLVRADADNTPFPDHIFDRVFAITLLQNMPNSTQTILEMRRVSKPEAVFILTGLKKKFTQEGFVDLLNRTNLKISTLTTDEQLKGYVAVCTNLQEGV